MKKMIIFILAISCFYSCNDADNNSNSTDINIVTGMNLVDNLGNNVGVIGNPNVLNNAGFVTYPNPAIDVLTIVGIPAAKNIWILKGVPTKSFSNTNFSDVLNANVYDSAEIKGKSVFEIEDIVANNLKIDLSRFEQGYYRVFVELEDGTIHWNNIYFRASQSDINDINFWN